MCFTKMIKKMVTAVCLLAVVGMFASCANSSGGSSSSGGSDPVKEELVYDFIYDGNTVQTGVTGKEFLAMIEKFDLKEGTDYKVNNEKKTVTFTKSGAEKVSGGSGKNGSSSKAPDYIIMLEDGEEDITLMGISEEEYNKTKSKFTASDYTVNNNVITINDSGLAKLCASMKIVGFVVYQKQMLTPVDTKFATEIATAFSAGTDYTLTHNGLIYELTKSGFEKGKKK